VDMGDGEKELEVAMDQRGQWLGGAGEEAGDEGDMGLELLLD
jgi:hypothetical protein